MGEPVGRAPLNMEAWIAEKNNEFNAIMVSDADSRNINMAEGMASVSRLPEEEEFDLVHLQRKISNKNVPSEPSNKRKETRQNKAEDEKLKKEQEKKAKKEETRQMKEAKKHEDAKKIEQQNVLRKAK